MAKIRKTLHDKLITDFGALTHDEGGALFTSVKKIFLTTSTPPVCRIIPIDIGIDIIGNTSDYRLLGFQSDVFEYIEASSGQTEAETRIDRLSNIEDKVLDYLEQIPNPIEHFLNGYHVIEINTLPSTYTYEDSENGIAIVQSINFVLKILITPQLL